MDRPATHTATVRVITAYEGDARWFMAVTDGYSREVATYDVHPACTDCPDTPHPDAVAKIERMHPGCFLVYID